MNKDELITAVAAKTGYNKKSAQEAVDAVLETIMDIVRDGDKVAIAGFGTFLLVERGRPHRPQPPHRRADPDPRPQRTEVHPRRKVQRSGEINQQGGHMGPPLQRRAHRDDGGRTGRAPLRILPIPPLGWPGGLPQAPRILISMKLTGPFQFVHFFVYFIPNDPRFQGPADAR